MVKWSAWSRRRKINVPVWLDSNGIKSYDSLAEKLRSLGVEPPALEEVKDLFLAGSEQQIEKVQSPTPKDPPSPEEARAERRRLKKERKARERAEAAEDTEFGSY